MNKTTEAIYKYLDSQCKIDGNVIHVDCVERDFNNYSPEFDKSSGTIKLTLESNNTIIDRDIEVMFGVPEANHFWDWTRVRIGDKVVIIFIDGEKLRYENERMNLNDNLDRIKKMFN